MYLEFQVLNSNSVSLTMALTWRGGATDSEQLMVMPFLAWQWQAPCLLLWQPVLARGQWGPPPETAPLVPDLPSKEWLERLGFRPVGLLVRAHCSAT